MIGYLVVRLWCLYCGFCPPTPEVSLADLRVFPPTSVADEGYRLSRTAFRQIEATAPFMLHTEGRWDDVRTDSCRRMQAWQLLTEGHCPDGPDHARIESLVRLRNLLGPRDYYAGRMPCPVPLYALPRCD